MLKIFEKIAFFVFPTLIFTGLPILYTPKMDLIRDNKHDSLFLDTKTHFKISWVPAGRVKYDKN
jgi:hypothetical protein